MCRIEEGGEACHLAPLVALGVLEYVVKACHIVVILRLCVYEVLGYLLLVMSRLVKANAKSKPQLSPPERYVKKVKQYIEDNYSLSITVSDVAFNAGLDRTYLYRLFMKHVGMSPQHYLSDYRLKRAAQMLEDRARPIGEISASVGFRDTSYFYKVFTHKFKKTPKKYREDLAKSDTAHNGEK